MYKKNSVMKNINKYFDLSEKTNYEFYFRILVNKSSAGVNSELSQMWA